MENVREIGIFLNAEDIKRIVEGHLEWAEVVEGQIFCAKNVMSEKTPIGTSIIIGVDGIKCEDGSDEIRLIISDGKYEINVKTVDMNDELNIRFDHTLPVPGTFGQIENGELDILTDEEKVFKKAIDCALGDREDEYAELFRKDNSREIGGRGLVLLEKVKAEIKGNTILSDEHVSPHQLAATFIELTERYVDACENVDKLSNKHDALLEEYKATYEEGSKRTKKLANDIEKINNKIDANNHAMEYYSATINAAVLPVLNMDLTK